MNQDFDNLEYPSEQQEYSARLQEEQKAQNAKSLKKAFSMLGFALAITLCVTIALQTVVLYAIQTLSPDLLSQTWILSVISSATLYIGMAVGYLFLRIMKIDAVKPQKKPLSAKHWIVVLLISFAAMYTGNAIGTAFTGILSTLLGYQINNGLVDMLNSAPGLLAIFISVTVVAPIVEELFFRKMIIDRLSQYGERSAIFCSAMLFGLYHGNFSQFFYAAALGLILGFIYCKTGNVKHTVALHATINFFGSVVPMFLQQFIDLDALNDALESNDMQALLDNSLSILVYLAYSVLIYAVWIIGAVLFFLNLKKYTCKKSELLLPEGTEKARLCYLNAGIITVFIFCALMMISSVLPSA